MVSTTFMRIVSPCFKPSGGSDNSANSAEDFGRVDGLLWYKDLGQHVGGEFSMAVIQANSLLEDYSQLESGPLSSLESGPQGTFVGIYDGHGGPEAARFVNDRLFENIKSMLITFLPSITFYFFFCTVECGFVHLLCKLYI